MYISINIVYFKLFNQNYHFIYLSHINFPKIIIDITKIRLMLLETSFAILVTYYL
jgi:hypothetical protein